MRTFDDIAVAAMERYLNGASPVSLMSPLGANDYRDTLMAAVRHAATLGYFTREAEGSWMTPAPTPLGPPQTRGEILDAAKGCVCQDRNAEYGPPEDSFAAIAGHWNWWLGERLQTPLTALDVAEMMVGLKQARTRANPGHVDSHVDKAGYAACAGEIAIRGAA